MSRYSAAASFSVIPIDAGAGAWLDPAVPDATARRFSGGLFVFMSMGVAIVVVVTAMLAVVMVVAVVVSMVMITIVTGMIVRMTMRGVVMGVACRMRVAAVVIGAAFGIERRLDFDHPRAQPLHHFLDHVVAANPQRFGRNLRRQMTIAKMPGHTNQMLRVLAADLKERFGRCYHFDQPAVLQHQRIAAAQGRRVL